MIGEGTTSLLHRLSDDATQDDWRLLVERYWRLIYAFGRRHGLDAQGAEDFTQDILVELSRVLPGFEYDKRRGSFRSFLLTICQRRFIDRLRAYQRAPVTELFDASMIESEEAWWETEWKRSVLRSCLDETSRIVAPRTFQAFQLVVIEEWAVKRVAAFLDMSVDSVYQSKARVIMHARRLYEQLHAEEDDNA